MRSDIGGPEPDALSELDSAAANRDANDPLAAIAALERMVTTGRDQPGPYLDLGLLYAQAGRFEEAAGALLRGLDLDPDNRTARYNYSRVLLATGRTGEAILQLEKLAQAAPEDAEVALSLIEARLSAGDRARALKAAGDVSAAGGDGRVLAALGGALVRAGELEEAAAVLAKAVERSPAEAAPWLELARLRQRRGDPEEAVLAAERAVRLAPGRMEVALGYAEALISAQQQERARDYLAGLGPRFRSHPGYSYTLGVALFGLHRYMESAAALERAVDADPSWGTAHFLLGTSRLATGDARGAVEAYRGATAADPGNPLGFVYLARAYGMLGPKFGEAALQAARQALQLDPDNVESLVRVARHALETGDLGEARASMERTVRTHPDIIKPRILLARAYHRLGLRAEAAAQEHSIRTLQAAQQARDTARGEAGRDTPSPGYGLGVFDLQ